MTQKAPTWLLILGWIFAFLGGLIGIVIGAYIKFGKVKDASGTNVPRYDSGSQTQGLLIMLLGIVMMIAWNVIVRMR